MFDNTIQGWNPFFSIQLDKSTDVANCAQLMLYVCYIKELSVQEEFLFCHRLPSSHYSQRNLQGFE